MSSDRFTTIWVSHTSIKDFLNCPRAYFLKHVYRDPKTGHRIKIASPPLSLGQAVHEVIESLSRLPKDKRLNRPLLEKFNQAWEKVSGKRGGFISKETENRYRERGKKMLQRVIDNPGPIARLAVKIKMDLPHFWLSEKDNIILCGRIDWLEYLPETDSVHIIDFKTGRNDEGSDSLQLPIYHLLASHCQKRKVTKTSYWYLERSDRPVEKPLPKMEESFQKLLKIAKKIKLARQLERFRCPHKNGCSFCKPMEAILRGEGEFVGTDDRQNDIYLLDQPFSRDEEESVIL